MTKKLTVYQKTERLLGEDPALVLRAVLESAYWPHELSAGEAYTRIGDDTSGDITVIFPADADGWISIYSRIDPEEFSIAHRFRCGFGGGESLRVRNALLALALAIKLDNGAFPQHHRRKIKDPLYSRAFLFFTSRKKLP